MDLMGNVHIYIFAMNRSNFLYCWCVFQHFVKDEEKQGCLIKSWLVITYWTSFLKSDK